MLQKSYPGGVAAYVSNAKALLAASKEGANPFEGFTPEVRAWPAYFRKQGVTDALASCRYPLERRWM